MTTGSSSIAQLRPDELVDVLTADFQRRAEPNFAWKSLVSSFMWLHGLRALWPMSATAYTAAGQAVDVSGNGNHLTNANLSLFRHAQWGATVRFDGATQRLNGADGGAANWADIIGTEAYIDTTPAGGFRGLTYGGFFFPTRAATLEDVIVKWGGAGGRSYKISFTAADTWEFVVSTDGTATAATATSAASAIDDWYFVVGRFVPSTSLDIFVNNVKVSTVAGIPATLFDSAVGFRIGASSSGANFWEGITTVCFLCATALTDGMIGQLFEQSRAIFGGLL